MLRSARFVVLASLALFAIASPSHGFSSRSERREIRAVAFGESMVQALGRLWELVASPRLMKAGVSPDPNGACGTGPAPSCGQQQNGEAGLSPDPHGGK
jgi:hypothetical protein